MDELLLLCGYEAAEMEKELPRVKKAFTGLGMTDEDISRGKERVRTYFDVDLAGVRELLGMFVRELVNMVLARDEGRTKIIHACMAGGLEAACSAFVTFSKDVFVEVPNPPFMVVLGSIFGRFVPVLEEAERLWLKSGLVAHCAMVKSRVGILSLGLIPRPDVLVTSGLVCETSPKTNDIMQELYSIPAVCYDTCQDREMSEHPGSARSIALEAASMRKAVEELGRYVGFHVEDYMVRDALRARAGLASAVDRVHRLIRESDPVPLGSTHDNPLTWLLPVAMSIEGLGRATNAVNRLYDELQGRVEKSAGATRKGAPRLLNIQPSHHSDPRLEHLVNELDMVVIGGDFELAAPPEDGVSDTDDPYITASQLLRGSMAQPLAARVKLILDACRKWNIDGVLDHFHVGCRGLAADALIIRDAVAKELGIPVLVLEWENFDPRVFDYGHYRTRLETFRAMIEGNSSRDRAT